MSLTSLSSPMGNYDRLGPSAVVKYIGGFREVQSICVKHVADVQYNRCMRPMLRWTQQVLGMLIIHRLHAGAGEGARYDNVVGGAWVALGKSWCKGEAKRNNCC